MNSGILKNTRRLFVTLCYIIALPASLLAAFLLFALPVPYSTSPMTIVALYGVVEFSRKEKRMYVAALTSINVSV